MNAREVANALTRQGSPFCRRRWVVVPNVSWGWGLNHEADLIAVSQSGWADEIEIKIDAGDLRNDYVKEKWSRPFDDRIKRFWFAVPELLLEIATALVRPEHGIIVAKPGSKATASLPIARVVRRAQPRKTARKVTNQELCKLLHLGVMRYWDLRLTTTTKPSAPTGEVPP